MWLSRNELKAIQDWQRAIFRTLEAMQKDINRMSAVIDRITAEVRANTDAANSIQTAVTRLADEFARQKDDPAAILALADELRNTTGTVNAARQVAEAALANTDAEPE